MFRWLRHKKDKSLSPHEKLEIVVEEISVNIDGLAKAIEVETTRVVDESHLRILTVTQLKDMCKERGYVKYSSFNKNELIELLSNGQ